MLTLKQSLTVFALIAMQTICFAQTSNSLKDWEEFNWKDSSKVPTKRIPQYNQFLHNEYPYPAKPRSQWELGFNVGVAGLMADVDSRLGYGFGFSLRKAIDNNWSFRASYTGMSTTGMETKARKGSDYTGIWNAYGNNPFYANYKNTTHILGFDMIYSILPHTFYSYKQDFKLNFYLLAGFSTGIAKVNVDAIDKNGFLYTSANPDGHNFAAVNPARKARDIRQDLKNLQDGTYESTAPVANSRQNLVNNNLWINALDFGGGFAYKLNNKWNIGFEQKFTNPFSDDLDGIKSGNFTDLYSYTSVRINMNIGNTSKRVQPLWWINPKNYVYNELNVPVHMKIPLPKLPDGDGDGISDQFDLEPNTPAGAQVDSHGRAIDSDGDGVPDFKDKEKLTPATWFPVNNDGVGNAPEPACCKEVKELREMLTSRGVLKDGKPVAECTIENLPSIQFKAGNATLTSEAKNLLDAVATKLQANPDCKAKIIGHPKAVKIAQQLAYDRVSAIIKYLVEKQGISESRLVWAYDGGMGDENTIDIQPTTEDGPNTVSPPHPNLKAKQ
jgi:outer membrane protein OmpA-like peptidoglycan-associated protein